MINVYGVPTCKKIQNTRKLLDENHIEYEFINVKKTATFSGKIGTSR